MRDTKLNTLSLSFFLFKQNLKKGWEMITFCLITAESELGNRKHIVILCEDRKPSPNLFHLTLICSSVNWVCAARLLISAMEG